MPWNKLRAIPPSTTARPPLALLPFPAQTLAEECFARLHLNFNYFNCNAITMSTTIVWTLIKAKKKIKKMQLNMRERLADTHYSLLLTKKKIIRCINKKREGKKRKEKAKLSDLAQSPLSSSSLFCHATSSTSPYCVQGMQCVRVCRRQSTYNSHSEPLTFICRCTSTRRLDSWKVGYGNSHSRCPKKYEKIYI